MSTSAKFNDALRLAMHNLIRQKTRNAIMAAILAVGMTAYWVVLPIMDALSQKTVAQTAPLTMPCDLVMVMAHTMEYREYDVDGAVSRSETSCLSNPSRPIAFDSLNGFRSAEYATLEQAYTPGGLMDIVFGSPEASWFQNSIKMETGTVPAVAGEVILPRWFADRTSLQPGQSLKVMYSVPPRNEFREATYTVTGIFSTEFSQVDLPLVYEGRVHQHTSLELAEYASRRQGARLMVMLDLGGERLDYRTAGRILADAMQQGLPPGATLVAPVLLSITPDMPAVMAQVLASDVQAPAVNALFLSFIFVGVGLFTVLLLSFLERRRDIAVMKTVGISEDEITAMFMIEIAVVTIAAVALGIGMTSLAVRSLVATGLAGTIRITWSRLLQGIGIGFTVMFLAALFPVDLARVATVNQLLFEQKIYLFNRRVMQTMKGSSRLLNR